MQLVDWRVTISVSVAPVGPGCAVVVRGSSPELLSEHEVELRTEEFAQALPAFLQSAGSPAPPASPAGTTQPSTGRLSLAEPEPGEYGGGGAGGGGGGGGGGAGGDVFWGGADAYGGARDRGQTAYELGKDLGEAHEMQIRRNELHGRILNLELQLKRPQSPQAAASISRSIRVLQGQLKSIGG